MPPLPPTLPFQENIKAQNFLSKIRFLGYAGVQFNALLVPLLVFKITGSLSMAGLALFIEWIPKLGFYVGSGAFIQKFGAPLVHVSLDAARLLAFIVLTLCAFINFGPLSVWAVAICAGVYQCSSALSNVLFEQSVTRLWSPQNRSSGHARILQQDQYGSFSALIVGLLINSVAWLCSIALLIQFFNFLLVLKTKRLIYSETPAENLIGPLSAPVPSIKSTKLLGHTFISQLKSDIHSISKIEFLKFSSIALMIGVPAAFIFSSLPFFLERSQAGMGEATSMLSFLLLSKTLLSIIVLAFVSRSRQSLSNKIYMPFVGLSIIALSTLILSFPLPLWIMFASACLLGITGALYIPWLRSKRQELIVSLVTPTSRSGATGLLIAVDAASYLIAAIFLTFLGGNLMLATLMSSLVSFVALVMAYHFYFKNKV